MYGSVVKKYRSSNDIIYAILQAVERKATKTRIMYSAYISYEQINDYLGFLMERKLLNYDKLTHIYSLTEKGLKLLHLLDNVDRLMQVENDSDVERKEQF
jgi:predicted transcriptional regulator